MSFIRRFRVWSQTHPLGWKKTVLVVRHFAGYLFFLTLFYVAAYLMSSRLLLILIPIIGILALPQSLYWASQYLGARSLVDLDKVHKKIMSDD
jgi:hypothetical protein